MTPGARGRTHFPLVPKLASGTGTLVELGNVSISTGLRNCPETQSTVFNMKRVIFDGEPQCGAVW
jgi:hypothetical protein